MMDTKDDKDRSREREQRNNRRNNDRTSRFSDQSRDRSTDRGKDRGGMKSSNCRVYVSNIPYEFRWQDLKDLFRSQVGEVSFVELFVDENDKPRGCGIVEFAEPGSVKKCLESMHRFELKGRKIVIKEDFGNSRDKFGNLIGAKRRAHDDNRNDNNRRDERRFNDHSGGNQIMGGQLNLGGMGGGVQSSNTYGLSPAFLDELCISTPLNTKVFVANLEYKVDKKKLKEVFRMAGKVVTVDMPMGKDNQSRGFAVIEFDHPVEAVQAISMFHNQPLFERTMTVRMDRAGDRMDKMPEGLKSIGPGLGSNGEPLKDVARNLPSLNGQGQQQVVNNGPGILGAVPNLGNLNANALSSLNNVSSALGNLGNTNAVLQAANLAGIGGLSNNLLANTLGSNELTLAANLVQNNPSLASLAASSTNLNLGNRSDNSGFLSNQNQNNAGFNSNNSSNLASLARNYQSFDSKPFNFGGGGDNNTNRDNNRSTNNAFNNNAGGGGNNMMQRGNNNMKSSFSKKIIISNLPPTASYKMLNDKCQEFGTVEHVEEQGAGSIVVSFNSEWEAERAIKNMDRARIDGRTIDVRFF